MATSRRISRSAPPPAGIERHTARAPEYDKMRGIEFGVAAQMETTLGAANPASRGDAKKSTGSSPVSGAGPEQTTGASFRGGEGADLQSSVDSRQESNNPLRAELEHASARQAKLRREARLGAILAPAVGAEQPAGANSGGGRGVDPQIKNPKLRELRLRAAGLRPREEAVSSAETDPRAGEGADRQHSTGSVAESRDSRPRSRGMQRREPASQRETASAPKRGAVSSREANPQANSQAGPTRRVLFPGTREAESSREAIPPGAPRGSEGAGAAGRANHPQPHRRAGPAREIIPHLTKGTRPRLELNSPQSGGRPKPATEMSLRGNGGAGITRAVNYQASEVAGPAESAVPGMDPYERILCEAFILLLRTHKMKMSQYSGNDSSAQVKLEESQRQLDGLRAEWNRVHNALPIETEPQYVRRTGNRPKYHRDIEAVLNQTEDPMKCYLALERNLKKLVLAWNERHNDAERILQYRRMLVRLSTALFDAEMARPVSVAATGNTGPAAARSRAADPSVAAAPGVAATGGAGSDCLGDRPPESGRGRGCGPCQNPTPGLATPGNAAPGVADRGGTPRKGSSRCGAVRHARPKSEAAPGKAIGVDAVASAGAGSGALSSGSASSHRVNRGPGSSGVGPTAQPDV